MHFLIIMTYFNANDTFFCLCRYLQANGYEGTIMDDTFQLSRDTLKTKQQDLKKWAKATDQTDVKH